MNLAYSSLTYPFLQELRVSLPCVLYLPARNKYDQPQKSCLQLLSLRRNTQRQLPVKAAQGRKEEASAWLLFLHRDQTTNLCISVSRQPGTRDCRRSDMQPLPLPCNSQSFVQHMTTLIYVHVISSVLHLNVSKLGRLRKLELKHGTGTFLLLVGHRTREQQKTE